MHRLLKETVAPLGLFGVIFLVASLIENEVGPDISQSASWLRDDSLLIFLTIVATWGGVALLLAVIENAFDTEPASRILRHLRLLLEAVAAMLSAACGIFENTISSNVPALIRTVRFYQPWSTVLLTMFLVILVIGVPILQFWLKHLNLYGTKEAKAFLDMLENRYKAQVQTNLTDHIRRFDLILTSAPDEVSPPAPGGTTPIGNQIGATTEMRIRLWFENAGRRLLILAEPGGGKSTQLYLLGSALVEDAKRKIFSAKREGSAIARLRRWLDTPVDHDPPREDEHLYLPVILDLSTWHADRRAFDRWLVDEIVRVYQIHRGTARRWVRAGKLVPLLDALDVLDTYEQPGCVNSINDYLARGAARGMVVCCRREDYQRMSGTRQPRVKLALRGVVRLHPITSADVKTILQQAANSAGNSHLIANLERDPERYAGLLEALGTPLLLSLAHWKLSAKDTGQFPQVTSADAAAWDHVLFDEYVETVLRSKLGTGPKVLEEIQVAKKTLAWLGHELVKKRSDSLTFYLKDLQRDSLPTDDAKKRYDRQVSLIGMLIKVSVGPTLGVGVALVVSKVYALGGGRAVFGTTAGENFGMASRVIAGLVGGLGVGLGIGGSIDGLREIELDPQREQEPAGPRTRWQTRITRSIRIQADRWQALGASVLVGGIAAYIAARTGVFADRGPTGTLVGMLVSGFIVGLIVGLLIGPDGGLIPAWGDTRSPNGSFHAAVRKALRIFSFYALVGLAGGWLLVGGLVGIVALQSMRMSLAIEVGLRAAMGGALLGLGIGMSVGLGIALGNGGADALQHFLLRRALARSKETPARLIRFLKRAHKYTLLRREGSGYTFIVKSTRLRDYFARTYEETHPDLGTPRATAKRHQHAPNHLAQFFGTLMRFEPPEKSAVRPVPEQAATETSEAPMP